MVYNNMGNSQSGRGNYGKRDFGGPGGFRQMHKAVCGSCGRDCEVPFRPSGDRPVFCSNCFEKNRSTSDINTGTRRFEDRNFKRPYNDRPTNTPQNNDQLNAINTKLDKILAILTSADSLLKTVSTPPAQAVEAIKTPVVVEKKKKASKKTVPSPEA